MGEEWGSCSTPRTWCRRERPGNIATPLEIGAASRCLGTHIHLVLILVIAAFFSPQREGGALELSDASEFKTCYSSRSFFQSVVVHPNPMVPIGIQELELPF